MEAIPNGQADAADRGSAAEIRADVRNGIRGPVMLKWIELLLADHDERVRLEQERAKG